MDLCVAVVPVAVEKWRCNGCHEAGNTGACTVVCVYCCVAMSTGSSVVSLSVHLCMTAWRLLLPSWNRFLVPSCVGSVILGLLYLVFIPH